MKIPIALEGLNIIKIFLILAIAGYILGYFSRYFYLLSAVSLLITVFCIFFFRDPERNIVRDENTVLSPADGTVFEVSKQNGTQLIKIFMSPLNVHVQRAPVSGIVKNVEYKTGKFIEAFKPESSEVNEQNIMTFQSPSVGEIKIKQIAGFFARRIVCRVKKDDQILQGQRWGMIKFGSQVDLAIPEKVALEVKEGDKLKAGVSVIGTIKNE